jgi:hypothetical protein
MSELISELKKYVGRHFNADTKAEIEGNFRPFRVEVCDLYHFHIEDFCEDRIRCLVIDGIINDVSFF